MGGAEHRKKVAPRDEVRGTGMLGIQGVLQQALKHSGLDKDIARYTFVLKWPEVVGKEIALRTRPECIRGDTLVIRVINSAWAQELSFQKSVIIKRLANFLARDEIVKDVHFYVGEL